MKFDRPDEKQKQIEKFLERDNSNFLKEKKKIMSFAIPEHIAKEIKERSAKIGVSKTALVILALNKYFYDE